MATPLQRDFVQDNILDRLDALDRRARVLEETVLLPGGIVAARYTTNAGQSISDSTVTIINFEDQDYDTNNAVTTGASWKFTAPVTGYYHVTAAALFATTTTWAESEIGLLQLYKNGTRKSEMCRVSGLDSSAATQSKSVFGTDTVYLTASQYIDVRVYQTSGGALALYSDGDFNYIAITRAG